MSIAQSDWVLVATLVGVAVLLTSFMWVAYNSQLVWELKRDCTKRIEQANEEIVAVRAMLKEQEMQARVMGAMPIGRLIGQEAQDE